MRETYNYCEGCIFWSTHGSHCDYIGITGRARSKICPPGKACTVKNTDPSELNKYRKETYGDDGGMVADIHRAARSKQGERT